MRADRSLARRRASRRLAGTLALQKACSPRVAAPGLALDIWMSCQPEESGRFSRSRARSGGAFLKLTHQTFTCKGFPHWSTLFSGRLRIKESITLKEGRAALAAVRIFWNRTLATGFGGQILKLEKKRGQSLESFNSADVLVPSNLRHMTCSDGDGCHSPSGTTCSFRPKLAPWGSTTNLNCQLHRLFAPEDVRLGQFVTTAFDGRPCSNRQSLLPLVVFLLPTGDS